MKGHALKLKEKLKYALKEANYSKLAQEKEKDQVLDLQERMKKKLKLATLKSYACLNTHQRREECDKALNSSKENVTTETIEELEKLCQILEDKRVDSMEYF